MGEDAGSVFVLRNVANMVVNTDFNLMSGLQYAVNYLKIPDIIVCGHYDCGGVRASTATNDHAAPLENWLRNLRDVYRLHRTELDGIKDPELRHRRLVELNVIEQCVNLYKTGAVQRSRLESKIDPENASLPRIHPTVFDPKTGRLIDLQVDLDDYMSELKSIYGLYDTEALAL
jgi:carbonic anhydrase